MLCHLCIVSNILIELWELRVSIFLIIWVHCLINIEDTLSYLSLHSPTDGSLSTRLSEIYQKLEEIEADKAPARASMILAGLGFTPKMQRQPTKWAPFSDSTAPFRLASLQTVPSSIPVSFREFSGGWRMRLALARALFSLWVNFLSFSPLPHTLFVIHFYFTFQPWLASSWWYACLHFLLFELKLWRHHYFMLILTSTEPTNMLDMKAILWLEDYLQVIRNHPCINPSC